MWVPASHEHRRCRSPKCCLCLGLMQAWLGMGKNRSRTWLAWPGQADPRRISRIWPSFSSTALLIAWENPEQSHVWAWKPQHGHHKNQTHAKSPDAANSKHARVWGSGWKPGTSTELCCYYHKKKNKNKSTFGTDSLSHIQTHILLQYGKEHFWSPQSRKHSMKVLMGSSCLGLDQSPCLMQEEISSTQAIWLTACTC